MSYKLSTSPCLPVGDPVPPMVPLRPSQNFTTGIEGMFYKDYIPIDEKEIIQEGTTYDLKEANHECNRLGCRMFIRDNIDGNTSFHIKYSPRKDCCGLNGGYEAAGGCQCEANCPTCTCKSRDRLNTLTPTKLEGDYKELFTNRDRWFKIILFMTVLGLFLNNMIESKRTNGTACSQTMINGKIVESGCVPIIN